ncbi:beta strand repeat-containing protein [Treponema sp. R80B11-R83G3]
MATGTPSAFNDTPRTPAAPSVSTGNGKVTVTWAAVEGTTAYEVWTGTANNSASATKNGADITASLSATIENLTNGTTYYIWIKAKNGIGTSTFSPVASGKPIANATAPTISAGNGQLSAAWAAIAGADQYEVFCGTGVNPPQTATQTVTTTSAAISGLVNGTTYNVWVRGKNSTGTGAISSAASAKPVGNIGTVTLTTGGSGELALSWQAVSGADQYEVYYGTGNTIPGNPAQTINAPTTTAVIGGLANGTTYNVWVKPKNANGTGNASTVASGTPLATPGSLTVSAGNQQIAISWTAVSGASSYEVYYSATPTIPTAASFTVTELSKTITVLSNGTTYNFWVKAVNANGTSGASPMASGKPIDNMGTVKLVSGNDQLTASWTTVAGADEYEVYHSISSTMPESPTQTVSTTTVTISSLVNGTTYYVWVKGKNTNGTNSASAVASGVPMATPGALSLSAGNQQITLSWATVPGASSYNVYYSATTTIPNTPTDTVTVLNKTITGLTNGTTYNFWIKAVNANGTSGASPMASGKPIGNMGTVTVSIGNEQVSLSWSTVAGADQYEVYQNSTNSMPVNPTQTITANTFTISSLTNNSTYYFWVKPKNANGAGNASTAVSGKPLGNMGTVTLVSANGQLTASWLAVTGADQYDVYRNTSNSIPASPSQTVSTTTAAISSLTNGTTYYVWVKPKNATGTGGASAVVSAKPIGNMGTVTLISGNEQLTANWTIVAGAAEYDVYYSTSSTMPGSSSQTVTTTTATISSLTNGTTYYVWVKPKNANGAGAVSTVVSGVPIATPGTPTVSLGNQQVTISWTTVPGAGSYEIYQSTTTTIPSTVSFTVTETNKTITGLTNGTTYNFWIKAVNDNGTSGASPMASGKPIANMGTITVGIGNEQVSLSWSTVAGADQYDVYYSTTNSIPASASQTINAQTTTAAISSLTNNTTYYFWVKPKNTTGAGAVSAVVSGKPLGNMGTVTLVSANSQLTASWTAVTGADQYEVYYNTTNSIPASASQTINAPTTTAAISSLTNGTTYYVWVKPKNATGTGDASAVVNAKPIGNMGAVTLVSGSGQLTASWTAVAGADEYDVYYSTSSTMPGSPTQAVSTTTATISSLTNGTTYNVWVKPKNANGAGTVSTVVSGKPLGTPGTPILSPDYRQLILTWTTVAGADEYEVYYGTSSTPTTLATTTDGTQAYITGLTAGTTYYVRLRAKNANGVSAYGPSASGTPDNVRRPGLYRSAVKIGNQNLTDSLTYISTNAVTNDDFYIVLGLDESVSPKTLDYSNKIVGITLLGYSVERTITLNANGSLFTIRTGVTLILDENITLVGRSANNNSLVSLNGGNFIMNNGAKITGNTYSSYSSTSPFRYGGGVYVSSGTFTMGGGEISSNTADYGGGVYVGSGTTFTMNNGKISVNTVSNDGGGVYVGSSGTFIINGGEISGNTTPYGGGSGGGVQIANNGAFTMNGGDISGNTGGDGGGVFVGYSGFTMSGGEISGNSSSEKGGGVYVYSGTFNMNGGKISSNTASGSSSYSYGGGVYVEDDSTFTMTGGEISGNTADRAGGGVYVSGGTFTKSGGGTITGYASDPVNGNVVKDSSGVVQSNNGNAVYAVSNRRRETTAGPAVNLDSSVSGSAGGWE